jgi:hypothetical protein
LDGNCVIVRWGGKQPKENHQSVGDELDSAQRGTASLLGNGEARMEGKPDTARSLMGNVIKASWEPLGWLETEWWEVQVT